MINCRHICGSSCVVAVETDHQKQVKLPLLFHQFVVSPAEPVDDEGRSVTLERVDFMLLNFV